VKKFDFEKRDAEYSERYIRHYFKETLFRHFVRISKDFKLIYKLRFNSTYRVSEKEVGIPQEYATMEEAIVLVMADLTDTPSSYQMNAVRIMHLVGETGRLMMQNNPDNETLIRQCAQECQDYIDGLLQEQEVKDAG